jgi:hypothetical protein
MKERIEKELNEEKQIREELEQNLIKLRDEVIQKETIVS